MDRGSLAKIVGHLHNARIAFRQGSAYSQPSPVGRAALEVHDRFRNSLVLAAIPVHPVCKVKLAIHTTEKQGAILCKAGIVGFGLSKLSGRSPWVERRKPKVGPAAAVRRDVSDLLAIGGHVLAGNVNGRDRRLTLSSFETCYP